MTPATLSPLFTWRSAICESDLPMPARHLALTISLHMNERGGSAFPSVPTLAREMGASERTVERHLQTLEESGWIDVDRGTGRRSSTYSACFPGASESRPSPSESRPRGVRESPEGVIEDVGTTLSEDPHPSGSGSSSASSMRTARKPDPVWDAFVACFGEPQTKTERGEMNRAVAEVKEALAPYMIEAWTPDEQFTFVHREVEQRFMEADAEYDHFGPMAIAKGWTRLAKEAARRVW